MLDLGQSRARRIGLRIGPFSVLIIDRYDTTRASEDVLRRRTFLHLVPLPFHRLLLIGWLPL